MYPPQQGYDIRVDSRKWIENSDLTNRIELRNFPSSSSQYDEFSKLLHNSSLNSNEGTNHKQFKSFNRTTDLSGSSDYDDEEEDEDINEEFTTDSIGMLETPLSSSAPNHYVEQPPKHGKAYISSKKFNIFDKLRLSTKKNYYLPVKEEENSMSTLASSSTDCTIDNRVIYNRNDTDPSIVEKRSGKAYLLLSAVLYSVVGLLVKVAYGRLPWLAVVICQSYSYLINASIYNWGFKRFNPMGKRVAHIRGLLIMRGLVGATGFFMYYFGIKNLPLGDASALYFTSPIFTFLFSLLWTDDKVKIAQGISSVGGLIGVVLISRPSAIFGSPSEDVVENEHDVSLVTVAYIATLVGAVLNGLNLILIRKIANEVPPSIGSYYFGLSAAIASTIGLIFWISSGHTLELDNVPWYYWLCAAAVGLMSFIGQVSVSKAMQTETAFNAAIFRNLNVFLAYVYQVIIFRDTPNAWAVIGATLIVASVLLLMGKN